MIIGDYTLRRQDRWETKRAEVSSGSPDAALTATTSKWASLLANYTAERFDIPEQHDRVEVRFRSSLNNNNGTFVVLALRPDDDGFEICRGKAYAGQQEATIQIAGGTTYHCDKINIETDGQEQWLSPVLSTSEDDTANNLRASMMFKSNTYRHFLILITAVSAGSMAVDMLSGSR